MNTGMTDEGRALVSEALCKLLADLYALYIKTQHAHWNITGPEFYALHLLFEKQYEDLATAIDELAERVRALGFYPEGSLTAFKRMHTIPEADKVLPARETLHQLQADHEAIIRMMRRLAELADEELDFASVDMMGRRLNAHEKMLWMLKSQL